MYDDVPPTPSSPIDELLLEFMHDDLKKEQWPAFDKDFYNKLFKLQTERNIEKFIELEITKSFDLVKVDTFERTDKIKVKPIQIEKILFPTRPYHCKFSGCGYKATQSAHLIRHMRSHKNKQLNKVKDQGIYPCQYSGCNYRANKCVTLKNHMLSHTN
jgi:hypothetical protein